MKHVSKVQAKGMNSFDIFASLSFVQYFTQHHSQDCRPSQCTKATALCNLFPIFAARVHRQRQAICSILRFVYLPTNLLYLLKSREANRGAGSKGLLCPSAHGWWILVSGRGIQATNMQQPCYPSGSGRGGLENISPSLLFKQQILLLLTDSRELVERKRGRDGERERGMR